MNLPSPVRTPRPGIRWSLAAVAALLALYWLMAVSVSPRMGITADEIVHLTGGYSYWTFNDYRLHPENGTLPMRIAALPWLAMDLRFPALDSPHWLDSKVNFLGEDFFFRLGNPVDRMMGVARMMIALTGAATAWLTWRWARGLFGPHAGWIALALAVFCPALLAHGGLATSDMTMTLCVLGALTLVWRTLHRATPGRVLAAGIACGLAFLSKMSGVILVPLIAGLVVWRCARGQPFVWVLVHARWVRGRPRILLATSTVSVLMAALSLVVLWGGYGFRYEGFNRKVSAAEGWYFSWDAILDRADLPSPPANELSTLQPHRPPRAETAMTRLIGFLRDHRLLPEAYLWGFAHTYKFSRHRPAFLDGEYRTEGWVSFFPLAFLWKTTLPALVLLAAGLAALGWNLVRPGAGRRAPRWLHRAAPLLLFLVGYWMLALRMQLNIGHRHILPTYPVCYVLASGAVLWLTPRHGRLIGALLATVAGLHAAESLASRPFYLSYFQPLAGGPNEGWRHLVDSSYDWGQGLPDLKRWLAEKRDRGDREPVFLTYFGADLPQARDLGPEVTRFGDLIHDGNPRVFPARIRGGWYVISATHFQGVYLPVRGTWLPRHEELYQLSRRRLLAAQAGAADAPKGDALTDAAILYEALSFGRLTCLLHQESPRAIIGGSMLVFRLSDRDVQRALLGPPPFPDQTAPSPR